MKDNNSSYYKEKKRLATIDLQEKKKQTPWGFELTSAKPLGSKRKELPVLVPVEGLDFETADNGAI